MAKQLTSNEIMIRHDDMLLSSERVRLQSWNENILTQPLDMSLPMSPLLSLAAAVTAVSVCGNACPSRFFLIVELISSGKVKHFGSYHCATMGVAVFEAVTVVSGALKVINVTTPLWDTVG